MLTDRAEGLMRFSRVTKYAAVAASCLTTAGLTAPDGDFTAAFRAALMPTCMMFFAQLACGPSWYSWGRTYFRRPSRTALRMTLLDSLLAGLGLLAIRSLMPTGSSVAIPLRPCFVSAATTLLLLNRFLPSALSSLMFRHDRRPRILVLGPTGARQIIRRQLDVAQAVGLEIVDSPAGEDETNGLRVFKPQDGKDPEHPVAPIHSRIHQPHSPHAVDRVVFVHKDGGHESMELQQEIHRRCSAAGLPLTVYTEQRSAPQQSIISISTDSPGISPTAHEPLENPVNQAAKRTLDVLIAIPFVLFVLPPLAVLVRIIHALQSPGPLFYQQERCGQNGSMFHIFKFRTMHVPKPGQTDLEDNPAPRIFELGAVLRDSRLDEIPQFLNVLLGTMSVVGPRAHHIQDRIKFSRLVPQYPMRMQAKPGITGPAQYLEYRGAFHRDSVESRVSCDLDYINRWSMQGDLILMLKTGRVIGESLYRAALSKLYRPASTSTPAVTLNHQTMVPVGGPANQSQAA